MHVVVNHLHFREPVSNATLEALQSAVLQVVDAGGVAARVALVDDRHLVLLLDFRSAEDAERVAREVGARGCASTSSRCSTARQSGASARWSPRHQLTEVKLGPTRH